MDWSYDNALRRTFRENPDLQEVWSELEKIRVPYTEKRLTAKEAALSIHSPARERVRRVFLSVVALLATDARATPTQKNEMQEHLQKMLGLAIAHDGQRIPASWTDDDALEEWIAWYDTGLTARSVVWSLPAQEREAAAVRLLMAVHQQSIQRSHGLTPDQVAELVAHLQEMTPICVQEAM